MKKMPNVILLSLVSLFVLAGCSLHEHFHGYPNNSGYYSSPTSSSSSGYYSAQSPSSSSGYYAGSSAGVANSGSYYTSK